MHKIDGAGHVANAFVAEDVATNRPPTEFTADWANAIQEELANLVTMNGAALNKADNTQVRTELLKKFSTRIVVAGGAADALTADFTPDLLLTDGMPFYLRALSANTLATPTLNVDATSAKTIVKGNNLPLKAGDISAGSWIHLQYDLTLDKYVLLNPVMGLRSAGYMLIQDQKASGVAGGASIVGIQTRVLNTVVKNTIVGASLSANKITLPAGGFRINARAPAFYSQHRCQIFNVTDNVIHSYGSNANGLSSGTVAAGDSIQTESFVSAYIELTSPKEFSLRSYTAEAIATNGLGQYSTEALGNEIYSSIEIIQDY